MISLRIYAYCMKKQETKNKKQKSIRTMDIILIIVGLSIFLFTTAMTAVFLYVGSVPDTLITCVFAVLGGECGVMGWIKTTKERRENREWEKEDKNRKQEAMNSETEDSNYGI